MRDRRCSHVRRNSCFLVKMHLCVCSSILDFSKIFRCNDRIERVNLSILGQEWWINNVEDKVTKLIFPRIFTMLVKRRKIYLYRGKVCEIFFLFQYRQQFFWSYCLWFVYKFNILIISFKLIYLCLQKWNRIFCNFLKRQRINSKLDIRKLFRVIHCMWYFH